VIVGKCAVEDRNHLTATLPFSAFAVGNDRRQTNGLGNDLAVEVVSPYCFQLHHLLRHPITLAILGKILPVNFKEQKFVRGSIWSDPAAGQTRNGPRSERERNAASVGR
jgi:hypothetical protein